MPPKEGCDKETIDREVESKRDLVDRIGAAMDPAGDRLEKDLARLACETGKGESKERPGGAR